MNIERLCTAIGLERKARNVVESYSISADQYLSYRELFNENADRFIEELKQQPNHRSLILYLYIRFAVDLHDEYERRGISDWAVCSFSLCRCMRPFKLASTNWKSIS